MSSINKLSNSYRGFFTNIFGHRQKIFIEGLEFYDNKFWVQYRIHNSLKLYKEQIDVLLDMYPKSMFYDHDYIKLMRYDTFNNVFHKLVKVKSTFFQGVYVSHVLAEASNDKTI